MPAKITLTEEIKNHIINYLKEGLTDVQIGKKLNLGRKTVGKFRKELGYGSYKDIKQEEIDIVTEMCNNGNYLAEIEKETKLSRPRILKIVKENNLNLNPADIMTGETEKLFLKLYEEGKMDSEIAKILNIKRGTIFSYRKRRNLPTKFDYSKINKIDNNKFEELFNKGLSDYAIAKELNMSPDGIYSHRQRYGYLREDLRPNKPIELTDFQKQVLIGTLLGDSSFKVWKDCINPSISCAHGIKQKEYCEHKTKIFESLGAKCTYHKRNIADKRNGIFYEDYTMFIPANPILKSWYESLYKKVKVIPFDLLDNFTEVSLAFMYMDDGSFNGSSYTIATNCFQRDELNKFRDFLFEKFGLTTSLFKNNVLYIRAESRTLFARLIYKYVIPCMQYKLHI